jgi:metal-responsive CopG/Arc/MetJ family transcriptional regulator
MSTQVAVRLSTELIAGVDWLVARFDYDTRADAIRDAIDHLLREKRSAAIDEQYATAYAAVPTTTAELAAATANSKALVEEEPWEPWW